MPGASACVLGVALFWAVVSGSAYYPAEVHWRGVTRRRHHSHTVVDNAARSERAAVVEQFDHRRHLVPDCPTNCELRIHDRNVLHAHFQDLIEEPDTALVHFNVHFHNYNRSIMEKFPYMGHAFQAHDWVWASQFKGRRLLGLPMDADVLSLYILDVAKHKMNVHISTLPKNCLTLHSPECRLYAVRKSLIVNLTRAEHNKHRRDFLCHKVVNDSSLSPHNHSDLMYRCCDIADFTGGDHKCHVYVQYKQELSHVIVIINIIAVVVTLFSPVIIMKIKLMLKFDSVTKFFRASLKHGITGQRNYVIRVSSRQLINLSDPKPFSIPRFLFRLLFHCYGEGRCCIHWWGEWEYQPRACRKQSACRRCWLIFWRFFAVAIVYPLVIYLAMALYAPRLGFYASVLEFVQKLEDSFPLHLNINPIALPLLPSYAMEVAVWSMFSFLCFVYTVLLLSWPNNPLERCMLQVNNKKPHEHPYILYDKMTKRYKHVLHKLAYGDYKTKVHFFRVRWLPWGCRRVFHFVHRVLLEIPVVNICFNLTTLNGRLFQSEEESGNNRVDQDETQSAIKFTFPPCGAFCRMVIAIFVWVGFIVLLCGYSTITFYMVEFLLNVLFFTCLGAVLHASTVLPWVALAVILVFYVNDTLSQINEDHKLILQLIDENSPRISAVEDSEDVFREPGTIQILRTHNLGAVKFIDGDNTEYVSKELYYNVCTDLKCGWTRSLRRLFLRLTAIFLFVSFVFSSLSAVGGFTGSGVLVTFGAIVCSLLPKFYDMYQMNAAKKKEQDKKSLWAKIMPDILDRHIRVDRTLCPDEHEEELTTYDVRPVGLLEMDIPKGISWRSLKLWKFPYIVSADQQTQSHEAFIVALANKLAAAAFLSKIVTRAYSPELEEESVLRQWCLLVENCILEGSATASSINGVPVESIRLFPRDVQALVSPFDPGGTIDNVVDNINRELYGPFTKGVLITISNTTFAMCKLDNTIFAFNSSCHGEQVTDLFGAFLVATEFNTQNLQSSIKFIMDPYGPDLVPVYSMVPTEGFVFRSPEIMEVETPTESPIESVPEST